MLREYDIAGRYGGEEFAVVASQTTGQDMVTLAERIRQEIEQLDIQDSRACIRVTVSVGVSSLTDGDTLETFWKRADDALYLAKNEGRNRTVQL